MAKNAPGGDNVATVLETIRHLAGPRGYTYATNAEIAAVCGKHIDARGQNSAVSRALRELRETDRVTVTYDGQRGGRCIQVRVIDPASYVQSDTPAGTV